MKCLGEVNVGDIRLDLRDKVRGSENFFKLAGSSKRSNEPFGSVKCGEFLEGLSVMSASQEVHGSMKLVVCFVLSFQNL
jgi:hypothetical protein